MIGDEPVHSPADESAQSVGGPGGPEPCRDCRAPLVPGQRYCLYCGARVPQARLEFLDVLVQDIAGVGAAPAAVPVEPRSDGGAGAAVVVGSRSPGVNGWLREHAPVLGLTGIVLGTLLIGLLIGHWATSDSSSDAPAKAAAPVVVRVPATAAAAAAAPAAGTATTAADSASADGGGKASAASRKQKDAKASDSAAKTTAKAPANAVSTKALSNLSGQDKEKAIEKAAKKGQPIATGDGKLPPTDSKAPAGGTDFETIG